MPFFRSRQKANDPVFNDRNDRNDRYDDRTTTTTTNSRKGGMFSGRRSVERQNTPPIDNHTSNTSTRKGGLFGGSHRRSSSEDYSDNSMGRSTGRTGGSRLGGSRTGRNHTLAGRDHFGNEPSIMAARGKLQDAEQAEAEALRALDTAKRAVTEARDHIRILEREAEEDARLAKAKQQEAKSLNKGARGLGRI